MVIPVSYTIVRSTDGSSTLCQAVVDSASESESINEFDFTFILAPDVSLIDMFQLIMGLTSYRQILLLIVAEQFPSRLTYTLAR